MVGFSCFLKEFKFVTDVCIIDIMLTNFEESTKGIIDGYLKVNEIVQNYVPKLVEMGYMLGDEPGSVTFVGG